MSEPRLMHASQILRANPRPRYSSCFESPIQLAISNTASNFVFVAVFLSLDSVVLVTKP